MNTGSESLASEPWETTVRNSTLITLLLTTSLSYGCDILDKLDPNGGGDQADTGEGADITLDDLPAQLKDLISSDLLEEMASQGPDAMIDVIIELDSTVPEHGGEDPNHIEMVNHPVDGTLYVINDLLGDDADLEAHMDDHYDDVQAYLDALHDLRADTIIDFLEHNDWDASHDAYGPAMNSLHHDVRHTIANRDIPAFILHNIDHLFGLHLEGEPYVAGFDAAEWEATLEEAMSATSLDGATAVYGGKGISMYIHEFNCPTDAIMGGGEGSYTGGDEPRQDEPADGSLHGDLVGHMVANAAPDADVYCSVRDGRGYYPPATWLKDMHIGTVSTGTYADDEDVTLYGGEYSRDAMTYDNNAYDYGVAYLTASGNGGSGTLAYISTGSNAISVGSWDGSNDEVASYSSSDVAQNGLQKPEVVMHHVVSTEGIWGTSLATPLAAGLAANVMEDHEIFRKHPALLKAHLMSSAHKVNGNDFDDEAGAGYLDWQTASWDFAYLMAAYEPYFELDAQGREVWSKSSELEANTTYRIGLAWLADGDWMAQYNELNMDMDLEVCSPSGICWESNDRDNAWELLEFETPEAGEYTYTMIMERRETTAKRNALKLGLAVNVVTD